MNVIDFILGVIQGATEFLPVSSSGHLFLAEKLLTGSPADLSFVLLLHVATLLAVLCVFFKDIRFFVFNIQKQQNFKLFLKLCVALIPLFFVGLFFKSFVQQSFTKNIVALGFFSTGGLLLSLFFATHNSFFKKTFPLLALKNKLSLQDMSYLQAFFIGLAQSLAVLPGFSRSAWTIAIGLYCGLSSRSAVYFSFLISIPAIAGSFLIHIAPYVLNPSPAKGLGFAVPHLFTLLLPFTLAFVSGLLSLLLILKMAQKQNLFLFSFYLLPLSVGLFFFF